MYLSQYSGGPVGSTARLGSGARVLAYILLALGAIGAVGSAVGLLVMFLVAREHVDTAFRAFLLSGSVLCAAAVLFGVARRIEGGQDG
jgi:hypothetical protein